MDVRCDRCGTEYDFDDALVSERGTTVKCTNCGHQFKVYPIRASGLGPERWVVRAGSGQELVFTSLRELQKGIADGKVGPHDLLSRGGRSPRPLSSIAELEPFFNRPVPTTGVGGRTLVGVAPPAPPDRGVAPAPEPYLPSPSNRPPVPEPAPERKRGTTVPRLPPLDPAHVPASLSEPPTQRRAESSVPPATQPAPAVEQQARVAAPGRLRANTAGVLADTLPVGSQRSPFASRPPQAPPAAAGERSPLASTVRVESSAAPRPATGVPGGGQPWEPVNPDAATVPVPIVPEPPAAAPRPAAGAAAPAAPPQVAQAAAAVQVAQAAAAAPPQVAPAAPAPHAAPAPQPTPDTAALRQVPAVAPVEPPPQEVVAALAQQPDVADVEQFFTPAPRELSFQGSLSDPDPRYVPRSTPRGARARWIVGFVLVGALALIAGTLGLRFVKNLAGPPAPPPAVAADPRVAELLAKGQALVASGDLDGAAEALSKASALADKDAKVRAALAELEVVRADTLWLELRLLDRAAGDRVEETSGQLVVKVKRAKEAVDAAVAVGASEPAVVRGQIDLLRLAGKVEAARKLVGPLSANASQPENAYVLALLDLAEAEPAYTTAIERLTPVAKAEGGLGRARAALVYALAMSGDLEAARTQLTALATANGTHPLLAELRAFLKRIADGGADAALDADELAALEPAPAPGEPGSPGEGAGDFRAKLAQANSALRNGHLDQADRLYRAVLAEQPGNTEAMAGLAEVAQHRNDPNAAQLFDQVLEKNPSYLPALVARADQKWDAGDRAGALTLYRRILAQAGASTTYGQHAQARIAAGDGGGAAPPPRPAPETSSPPPGTTPPPAPEPPAIDTTDLPGFQ